MNRFKSEFIYDRSGYYSNYLNDNVNFPIDPSGLFIKSLHRFWLRLLGASKEVNRNNYWLSIKLLTDAREQLIIMKRAASCIYPPGFNFNKATKNVENDLPELSNDLLHTLNKFDYEKIVKSISFSGSICLTILEDYVKENSVFFL